MNITYQMLHAREQGVTLYLAMLTLSATLAIALFISSVFVREYKITTETVRSLNAVYIADTAMEHTLYQVRSQGTYAHDSDLNISTLSFSDDTGTAQTASLDLSSNMAVAPPPSTTCPPGISAEAQCKKTIGLVPKTDPAVPPTCANSSIFAFDCTRIITNGSYRNTNRAMEIVYPNL